MDALSTIVPVTRHEVSLVVPADAAYLRTVRLVAADAAARCGFLADELDDTRIAIDELCYALMASARAPISVTFRPRVGVLEAEGRAEIGARSSPFVLAPLSERMLGHLAESYEVHDEDGPWFRVRLVSETDDP